jgi:hypothetical protein
MANETTIADKPKDKNGDKQPDVMTGPQPKAPTPLDPPEIYFNQIWRVPALVVETQEQKDALDPNEWIPQPPAPAAPPLAKATRIQYPALYTSSNLPPIVVTGAEHAKTLDSSYAPYTVPTNIAQAAVDAAKKQDEEAKKQEQQKPKPPAAPQPQHK